MEQWSTYKYNLNIETNQKQKLVISNDERQLNVSRLPCVRFMRIIKSY